MPRTTAFSPATWTAAIEWWDASDGATVFQDSGATTPAVAGSTIAAAIVGKKLGAIMSNATAGTTPEYVTDANGRNAIDFVRANNDHLETADATIVGEVTGDDNPYGIVGAFKRGTADVSVTPVSFSRDDGGVVNDRIRHFFGATDAVGITRTVIGASTTASSSADAVPANNWYAVAWLFAGTTVTVRVNGVVVGAAVALNTLALTISKMALGGLFENVTDTWDSTVAFDGSVGEVLVLDGTVSSGNATLAEVETYLMAKWTN